MFAELLPQPLTIAAICFPILIAFLTYFKTGFSKWWFLALILGAVGFWRLIVLSDQFIRKDLELANNAIIANGGLPEPRSNFSSNILGSYGLLFGLCLTGALFLIMKIARGLISKSSRQ